MNEFKAGDSVLCISMPSYYSNKLQVGHVYTICKMLPNRKLFYNEEWFSVIENDGIDDYETKYFINVTGIKHLNLVKLLCEDTER